MLFLAFGLLLVAIIAIAFAPGHTPGISKRRHPNCLTTLERVAINGTMQWVLIRSENVSNPVILFIHGGPGTSQLTLNRRNTRVLERHFTVVNWDQRGAGKSFAAGRNETGMTLRQFVDDVIALSFCLARRFQQREIILVGHSWGSAVGLLAVAERPDLYSAYVGVGQVSDPVESDRLSYEWTLEQARKANDAAAVQALVGIGEPPWVGPGWRSSFMKERRYVARYGGEYHESRTGALGVVLKHLIFSPEYTIVDRINFFRGIFRSATLLYPDLLSHDLFADVPYVHVPVFFCLGRHDHEVPSVLSARYFAALSAPSKELIWFERSAHMPNTEERDRFNAFLIDTVLPQISGHPGSEVDLSSSLPVGAH